MILAKKLTSLRSLYFPHLFAGIILLLTSCSTKPSIEKLKADIINELSQREGEFAIAYKDLTTGEELLINENEAFHAASTMKTPVMIEIFKQANEGKLSLDDSILVKNTFKSIVDSSSYQLDPQEDSDQTLYNKVGSKKTLGDLVYDMIIVSSNLATNIVIEVADAKKVTGTMRNLGAKDIQVLRGVEDQKAYEAGLSNSTTAYDLMMIYEKLAQRKAVSPEADNQMMDILLDQELHKTIARNLPKDVKVAHKSGWITGSEHDAGIVILPDGRRYVIVLLSRNLKDVEAGVSTLARVSELIYQYTSER